MSGVPPNAPPLPPGASSSGGQGNTRYGHSPAHSSQHSREQSPSRLAQRDPFMASHETLGGPPHFPTNSLNAPGGGGGGSFTTGSNYGTAPSSPFQDPAGPFHGASTIDQRTHGYGTQGSYGGQHGMSASSVQLTDFGAVDHSGNRYHNDNHEYEESRPLNEGAGFSGGFYPPPNEGRFVVFCMPVILARLTTTFPLWLWLGIIIGMKIDWGCHLLNQLYPL
jgi:hypothetical protein